MPPTLHPIRASPPPIVRPGGENHIRSDLSAGEKFNGLLATYAIARAAADPARVPAAGRPSGDAHFAYYPPARRAADVLLRL